MNKELEQAQTEVFSKYGVFFAFSNEQYEKNAVDGVKYISLGAGTICPQDKAEAFVDELCAVSKAAREKAVQEKGKKEIIWYELGNHETQITGDIMPAAAACEPYGITTDEVRAEYPAYFNMCIDNDCF